MDAGHRSHTASTSMSRPAESESPMTTTVDDQKKNATEALGAVRAFHKAQDTWNRLNWIKAPGELRQPAWADLGTTRKAMYDALLLDFGKQTQKLSGSMTALLIGCRSQFIDRKLLSWHDQDILTEVLRGMEAELRKIAGIKERSFAELIAEKVVQKRAGAKPEWNKDIGELSVGGVLVKKFSQPAANQRRVLDAFQEAGWPRRMDDPLHGGRATDPKRRLSETVRSLNKNMKNADLHFECDGKGEGVIWSTSN